MYRLYSDFFYNDRAIRLKFEEEFKDLIINKLSLFNFIQYIFKINFSGKNDKSETEEYKK